MGSRIHRHRTNRMGHMRVQVMWQHQAPDDAETPHLLLQPLLENAVFHGVESTHRPGMITVFTKLNKSSIYIRIENPYTPPESSENTKPHKRQLDGIAQPQRTPDADVRQRCQNPKPPTRRHFPRRHPPALPQKASDVNRLFG